MEPADERPDELLCLYPPEPPQMRAAMEPADERPDEVALDTLSYTDLSAAMEPADERPDEGSARVLIVPQKKPQWSRPTNGRMSAVLVRI